MSVRGFLAWYLTAVVLITGAGISAYRALLRLHVAASQTVVSGPTSTSMDALQVPPLSAQTPRADSDPGVRRRAAATPRVSLQHRPKLMLARHTRLRHPLAVRSVHRDLSAYQPPGPYEPEPPPGYPPLAPRYADPAYYPYPNYYVSYPPYGYYRGF